MSGIELSYHPRMESLAAELATGFEDRLGAPETLLEPATIVVPNRSIQAYLEQEISRRIGITPNLEFPLLRRFLADCLPGEIGGVDVEILGRRQLHHILVDLLGPESPDRSWLDDCPEVTQYLERPTDVIARERRLFQLSGELTRLFMEYGFSRAAPVDGSSLDDSPLLERWRAVGPDGPRRLDGVERWQQIVWWQIFGEGGVLERIEADQDIRYLTLADAFRQTSADDLDVPARFHMVGFSYIARLFVEAVHLLGRRSTIHVHALCPRADWIDDPPENLDESEGHLLLRQWGVAGADNIRMWNAVADEIRSPRAGGDDRSPQNLLLAMQRDIEAGGDAPDEIEHREGVQFFECPSIKREVEAVANEIWTLLRQSEDLRSDDIAVLIAGDDQQAYQAQIEAVFKSFENLRYTMVELPAGSESRVLEAARLLLELPFGRFTRRELLRLMVHPNTAGRGDDVDPERWEKWCHHLTILYAADRGEQADTYLGEPCHIDGTDYEWDVYNWDQGMRRLALGSFLSGDRSGVERLFEVDGLHYEPLEVPTGELSPASRFIGLAGSLISDARWLISPDGDGDTARRQTAREWGEQIAAYVETYLVPGGGKDDRYEYAAVLRVVRDVAASCPVDGRISYRVFYEFLRAELDELQRTRGNRLTDGVVVSSALSMRAIPFDHVFVVGLGEGQFPNPERTDSLDLRHREPEFPRLGDLKPADRDRYTFLEILLAARQGITLSWVARDATSGEPLEASSVVNQLRWALEERFGIEAESKRALTTRHPLRRFDYTYFPGLADELGVPDWSEPDTTDGEGGELDLHRPTPSLHEEARTEAVLRAMRDDLSGATVQGQQRRKLPPLDELRAELSEDHPDTWKTLRKELNLYRLPGELPDEQSADRIEVSSPVEEEEPAEPRRVRLTLSQLRKFLESPLQGAARVQLGLREDEDDLFGEEYGTVEAGRMRRAIILRKVAHEAVRRELSKSELPSLYDKLLFPESTLRNQLACGHFLRHDRKAHLATLKQWWDNFEKLGLPAKLVQLGFGRDVPSPGLNYDAIQLTLTPDEHGVSEVTEVELTGTTDPTSVDGGVYATFTDKPRKGTSSKKREPYFLRCFLSWIAATASGRTHPEEVRLVLNTTYRSKSSKVLPRFQESYSRWSQDRAEDYLKSLCASLLSESHDYLFPVELLAEFDAKDVHSGNQEHLQAIVDDALSSPTGRDKYGPIKDYERFGPPQQLDLAKLLRSRFPHRFGGEQ